MSALNGRVEPRRPQRRRQQRHSPLPLPLLLGAAAAAAAVCCCAAPAAAAAAAEVKPSIIVVGSINADTTVTVARLPEPGESIVASSPDATLAVGGKGANQAVAAARLLAEGAASPPRFVCRFGDDAHGAWMRAELEKEGLDLAGAATAPGVGSGQGLVWLAPGGAATSVVAGGANAGAGWGVDDDAFADDYADKEGVKALRAAAAAAVAGAAPRAALLLQREVPDAVNIAFAQAARAANLTVILDAGGVDDPRLHHHLIEAIDYIAPNEHEAGRLTGGHPAARPADARKAAHALMEVGIKRVLLTRGDKGAALFERADVDASEAVLRGVAGAEVKTTPMVPEGAFELWQPALVPPGPFGAVDATAAGDAYRAAFAVALTEGRTAPDAMRFAAAAGAAAAAKRGAMPSLPQRAEVEAALKMQPPEQDAAAAAAAGDADGSSGDKQLLEAAAAADEGRCAAGGQCAADGAGGAGAASARCPLVFASRLNSMRARRDLVAKTTKAAPADAAKDAKSGKDAKGAKDAKGKEKEDGKKEGEKEEVEVPTEERDDVLGWVARQGKVAGLGGVYFNFPEHFKNVTAEQVRCARGGLRSQAAAAVAVAALACFLEGMGLGLEKGPGPASHSTHDTTLTTHATHTTRARAHQHQQVKAALEAAGLKALGVAVRFPAATFSRGGALSHPDQFKRFAAISTGAQACMWAERLGAGEVVVWPQFDGYDYPLQASCCVGVAAVKKQGRGDGGGSQLRRAGCSANTCNGGKPLHHLRKTNTPKLAGRSTTPPRGRTSSSRCATLRARAPRRASLWSGSRRTRWRATRCCRRRARRCCSRRRCARRCVEGRGGGQGGKEKGQGAGLGLLLLLALDSPYANATRASSPTHSQNVTLTSRTQPPPPRA